MNNLKKEMVNLKMVKEKFVQLKQLNHYLLNKKLDTKKHFNTKKQKI